MQSALLNQDENKENDEQPCIPKLHTYWDKCAVFIHIFQQFYCYFLICYFWERNESMSRYGFTVAFAVSSFLGLVINIIWVSVKSNSYNRRQKILAWIVVIYYPFTILFLYINRRRYLLYGLLFTQTLFSSIPMFLINCYHLIHDYHHNNILLLFSIILFAISILFLYPLFHPLQTMNYKLLTLKLSTFSLQIMRILFTVYVFYMVVFPKDEVSNGIINDIYNLLLIKFFYISPGLVIWAFIWISFDKYTLDWFYVKNLKEIWREYNDSTCYIKVICFTCFSVRIIMNIFIIYPEYLILLGSFYVTYLWIFLEFYIFNIMDIFMFHNKDELYSNELKGFKLENYNFKIWNMIIKYLTNINDDLDYHQRLYIIHFLNYTNYSSMDRDTLSQFIQQTTNLNQGMECIIKGITINQPIDLGVLNKQDWKINSFWKFLVKKVLEYMMNQCKKLKMDVFFSVRDTLLNLYNFETESLDLKCNNIIGKIWEILGLFIIIPTYVISLIMAVFILPICIYVMYFSTYMNRYNFIDYLLDFKFWILNIYLLLLVISIILFFYQWRIIKIWYDCYMFAFNKTDQKSMYLSIVKINKYHNLIRNQKMIYSILTSFFGSLSLEIMYYLGMMDENDSIMVPYGVDNDLSDDTPLYDHDDSVVCNEYVFDLNIQ